MYDIPCDVVQDLLPAYIDGKTHNVTQSAIEEHINRCPACRKILHDMDYDIDKVFNKQDDIKKHTDNSPGTEKNVDYLKKNRSMMATAAIIIALITLAVIALIVLIYI